jgi:hypothetical protein
VITQNDIGETPEAGDHFGFDVALAPAVTDSKGAYLLVVDAPLGRAPARRSIPDRSASSRWTASPRAWVNCGTAGGSARRGTPESGDRFGSALALGQVPKGAAELIVGAHRAWRPGFRPSVST